jgi:hypothetical protein
MEMRFVIAIKERKKKKKVMFKCLKNYVVSRIILYVQESTVVIHVYFGLINKFFPPKRSILLMRVCG